MPAAERRGYASVNLRKVLLRNWFELPVYLQRGVMGVSIPGFGRSSIPAAKSSGWVHSSGSPS